MKKLLMGLLVLTAGSAFSIAGSEISIIGSDDERALQANWKCVVLDKTKNADISDIIIYNDENVASYPHLGNGKVLVAGDRGLAKGTAESESIESTLSISWSNWPEIHGPKTILSIHPNKPSHSYLFVYGFGMGGADNPLGISPRVVKMNCELVE